MTPPPLPRWRVVVCTDCGSQLFWTLIPAIAGVIEGILYLTMSDEEFASKYGE